MTIDGDYDPNADIASLRFEGRPLCRARGVAVPSRATGHPN